MKPGFLKRLQSSGLAIFPALRLTLVAAVLTLGHVLSPAGNSPVIGNIAEAGLKAVYIESLEGTYSVEGYNTNGSRYTGRVYITVKNGVAFFRWEIANDTYHGQGTLNGSVLTIDWGAADPVIYQVNPDGSLDGTWDRGRASERLVRIQ